MALRGLCCVEYGEKAESIALLSPIACIFNGRNFHVAGNYPSPSFPTVYEPGKALSIITVTGPSLCDSVVRKPHVEVGNGSPAESRQRPGLMCVVVGEDRDG